MNEWFLEEKKKIIKKFEWFSVFMKSAQSFNGYPTWPISKIEVVA